MIQSQYIRSIVALCLFAMGFALAVLPDAWIEMWFGIYPDGGNGFVEFLLAAVPLALGVVVGTQVLVEYSRHHRVRPEL